jgi:hypothetical protein
LHETKECVAPESNKTFASWEQTRSVPITTLFASFMSSWVRWFTLAYCVDFFFLKLLLRWKDAFGLDGGAGKYRGACGASNGKEVVPEVVSFGEKFLF